MLCLCEILKPDLTKRGMINHWSVVIKKILYYNDLDTEDSILYNISHHFVKTLLHYRVKHKSLKMLQLLYPSLMTKLSTPPFSKFFKNVKKHYFTYLFTALSSSTCTNHEFTTLRNCWTFGTAFNRVQLILAQLMESASWRLHMGQRRAFWAVMCFMIICQLSEWPLQQWNNAPDS